MNKKTTRIIPLMAVFGFLAFAITSCSKHDPNSPGLEYMPDMYRSPSLESNMAYTYKGEVLQVDRMPVAGTIARGYMPYPYPNTPEGYEDAGKNLHNPLEKNDINLKAGENLYGKFCVHCHGAAGQGDGPVGLKLPGAPPSYTGPVLMALPEGKMFHTITYGKNLMGSHASQLSVDERWKIILYVHKLQGK